MSSASDFFGVGGTIGIFPFFESIPNIAFVETQPFGFSDNGDYFAMPSGAATALEYRNNVNGLVWSITPTDINAAADGWISFKLDSVDNLLYITAFDESTNVVYLASINSAGTIVNIGTSSATTINLSVVGTAWSSVSFPNMIRDAEGTGNFTMSIAGVVTLVINSATGAIISETAITAGQAIGAFTSTEGVQFTLEGVSGNPDEQNAILGIAHPIIADKIQVVRIAMPHTYLGLPRGGAINQSHLSWGSDIILNAGNNSGSVRFDKIKYNINVNKIAKAMNII